MADSSLPKWFWLVAILALVWNLIGVATWYLDINMSSETLAALPEEQRNLYAIRPIWVTIAFTVATLAGLLGSALLIARKTLATPVFLLSLLGVLVQFGGGMMIPEFRDAMARGWALPLTIVIAAIGLYLFARHASAKGWLA